MANLKTIIRLAKLPMFKREFTIPGNIRVANADNYVLVWKPGSEDHEEQYAANVDGERVDPPSAREVMQTDAVIKKLSPDPSEMVKVNGNFLRRAISALETKGNNPIYISVHERMIILAYEVDGQWHRAAVACMKNRSE